MVDPSRYFRGSSPPITPPTITPPTITPPPIGPPISSSTTTTEDIYGPRMSPAIANCKKIIADSKAIETKLNNLSKAIGTELYDLQNVITTALSTEMQKEAQLATWISEFKKHITTIRNDIYVKMNEIARRLKNTTMEINKMTRFTPKIDNWKNAIDFIEVQFKGNSGIIGIDDLLINVETDINNIKSELENFMKNIKGAAPESEAFGKKFLKASASHAGTIEKEVDDNIIILKDLANNLTKLKDDLKSIRGL